MFEVILLLSLLTLSHGRECQISVDYKKGSLGQHQPLFINGSYQILSPDKTGILRFSVGQSILLACPGKINAFSTPLNSQQIIKASCTEHTKFKVNSKSYSFESFTCKKVAKPELRHRGFCLSHYSKIEIGFNVQKIFIPVIEICRNNETDESYYAKSKLSKSIAGGQQNVPRPTWTTQDIFHYNDVNDFYKKKHQVKIFGMILNSEELAQSYLEKSQLHRGHLAARADFVYGTEQNATFTLANTAPQWSSFNARNWKHIEKSIRDFVVDNDLEVTIYTGVHGQMTLRDLNGEEKDIYLDVDENNNGYLRVPKFFWKIIYDPDTRLALAVVGVNDPFRDEVTKDMFLCQDISDSPSVTWLTKSWNSRMEISAGVSYICHYKELKKVVPTVPDLNVKGILRNYRK